jgi:cell wall-associated NlpC family hydrolase
MKLFFSIKINEKLLLRSLVLLTLFLASCASTKKATVREGKVDKVISTARSYIGTPYRYGGTTRSGMDCSGLLINSFTVIDVSLPRSSADQSKVGKEIKKMSDLEPGDLVFFATGKRKKKVTHVGLVTDVRSKNDVKFIHASSSLGVVETNIYAEYYQKRFRGARRVIEER